MGYFEDTLLDLVQGRISAREAQSVLRHRANFSFGTNPAYVNWIEPLPVETGIPIAPADVRRALQRYLHGEWTGQELRDWAEFITLVGAYHSPEAPPEDEDYYDDLWDVVHDLGTPEIFGEITPDHVRSELARLDRYDSASRPAT
jgi:hypothetical protein